MSRAKALVIRPLVKPPRATIEVPGSKSITNRALILAALNAKGFAQTLRGAVRCEDTEVMIDCLRVLGFRVLTDWPDGVVCISSEEEDPIIPAAHADLFVGGSGTTMRFLTAMVALGHGCYRLDGIARMRQRPIGELLDALGQLGVNAISENGDRCPPVMVQANGLRAGHVRIPGQVSSQFVSAILLAATRAEGTVRVEIEGLCVSEPYVRLTVEMIRQFGLAIVEHGAHQFEVMGKSPAPPLRRAAPFPEPFQRPHHLPLEEYPIEPDASSASYFFGAAAITGGEVTVPQLHAKSLQGDVRFVEVLRHMGCAVSHDERGITVRSGRLRGIDVDMNDISDTVMTLAVVACFARGPTTIRNVAHIRLKESDRLAALATELRRLGADVDEFSDGLKITPKALHAAEIETYDDHRMAMAFSLAGLKVPGVTIKSPGCVAKTYPGFFDDLEKLR